MNFLQSLFYKLDQNGDNRITREEFAELLHIDEVEWCLEVIDLQSCDITTLFDLCDTESDGVINLREFVKGLHGATGSVRAVEVALAAYRQEQMMVKNFHVIEDVASNVNKILAATTHFSQHISDSFDSRFTI